jgi:DNA polymerase III subunit delta'
MAGLDLPDQHDSLPGVLEPVQTAVLYGQGFKSTVLASAYQNGRLHHALMFEGPAGIGKASLAFHLAQHLIACPHTSMAPDSLQLLNQESDDFRQLAQGTHLQTLHLTRPFDAKTEKFKTKITVDEIRRINHFLSRTNPGGGFRVVIIDPVNDMNESAANALLKNLEEPPNRTLFILVAHSAGRILPTIRSRCQIVRFEALDAASLKLAMNAASTSPLGPEMLDQVVLLAEGSVRRGLMLANFGGLEVTSTADRLISDAIFNVDVAAKLGDAMTSREADIQYQLLTDHLLQRVARASQHHAESGDLKRADTMASYYEECRQMLAEASAFNLDRKQTVFGLISQLNVRAQARLL